MAVAVWETVITSSPLPISNDFNERNNASVALPTEAEYLTPIYFAKFFSKVFT